MLSGRALSVAGSRACIRASPSGFASRLSSPANNSKQCRIISQEQSEHQLRYRLVHNAAGASHARMQRSTRRRSGQDRTAVAARADASGSGSTEADGYWTLQSYVLYEEEVKKSKFIVHAWPVSSAAQAMELIRGASDPSASHNCFAYRVGQEFRSSDDGEPSGTAGRPIQAAIDGEGLDRVAVLVTRFFGGTKLGAGGLVRAYGGAAKECLKLAPRVFAKAQVLVEVEAAYDELGTVYGCMDMYGAERQAEEYGSSGTVTLRALVDADRFASLQAAIADGTGGRRRAVRLELETEIAAVEDGA